MESVDFKSELIDIINKIGFDLFYENGIYFLNSEPIKEVYLFKMNVIDTVYRKAGYENITDGNNKCCIKINFYNLDETIFELFDLYKNIL